MNSYSYFLSKQFNFVGKILGVKGKSLKHLAEETMCRITILGRGSMKDSQKVCLAMFVFIRCVFWFFALPT